MTSRKLGTRIFLTDMTAFCDVAFVLMTFFILTSRPKPQEPVRVDTPASRYVRGCSIGDEYTAIITIGEHKLFFSLPGSELRMKTLIRMGKKYHVKFTERDQQIFAETGVFGMYMPQLKQFLGFTKLQRDTITQPGLPFDQSNHDLANWIYEARQVTRELHGGEMRIAIKADQKESYTLIAKTIALLQAQEINRFSLVTTIKQRTYDN